jgi:hypothetical protein
MAVGIAAGPAFTEFDRAPAERHERRPVRMRGHIILGDGAHHEIHLLDLSYEGCGIETAAELEPGQALKLSVLRRGAMDAVVRWTRGDKAGLAFVPDAAEATKRWPRRSERVALSAEVTLRRLGHTNCRVTVSDASPEGCKVELVERPSEGESVIVKFEGLEALEAQVCWIGGYTAGLKYARPMHPAVFDLLVERLG